MEIALRQEIARKYRVLNRRRNIITRRRILLQRLGRGFLVRRRQARRTRTMAFCFNPYDLPLNLRDKDDHKVYLDGCKGLKDDDLFDGSKAKYNDFAKLLRKPLENVRVMETFLVPTIWDDKNVNDEAKRLVLPEMNINIFERHSAMKDQVKAYVELFWETTSHGVDTPKYHREYATAPIGDDTLNAARNTTKLKSIMLGKKIWASPTSAYKKEITGRCAEFTMGGEYDGVLLWDFLRRTIKPSTKVGASKLKADIEKCVLSTHENNVTKFNSWFEDTRLEIIAEEGEGYNEYLRQLFRAYLTSNLPEFIEAVKEEQRQWVQGKLPDDYSHTDLLSVGRITYNNLVEEDKVNSSKKGASGEKPHFLALAAQLVEQLKGSTGNGNSRQKSDQNGPRTFLPWRYENPNDEKTKVVKGTTMKWCTNDCHEKPMWCGRSTCLNRADYAARVQKGREEKSRDKSGNNSSQPGGGKFRWIGQWTTLI